MLTDNYRLIKKIKTIYNFEIFLALSVEENKEVIIKTTKDLYTNEKDFKSLQSEHEKLKLCNNKYVIKTNELKKSADRYFLILEHFRARTIKMILENNKISVSDFIEIAINICEAFIEIHSKNIIHANLNTNSILLNKENEIKLTNFTYSIFEDEIYIKNEEHLDIYKAPEQTNKLKEKVTKQTDIYSLGLIFYEMLTGIIPYEIEELNSLSHNILTKEFTPLHNIDHNIPIILSNIIKKMLEKSPQDRYSDVVSILIDLKKLLLNLEKNNTKEFELDQFKKEFQSRKNTALYGRDEELDEIIENLNKNEENIIFVTGNSGIGKTAFVRSALEKSNIKKTNYLEIKLDNYKQNTPYKILYSKLRELSKKILTKDEETLLKWKNKILNELGNEISILFNIIPELEIIIGNIKLKEEAISNSTKIKINNYLFKYLQIFATKSEPLVIFIDDIQWADSITLNWIIDASFKLTNTHLILTSRNTKEESEILNTLIENLDKSRTFIKYFNLKALKQEDIKKLLESNFSLENSEKISKLIFSKTSGNSLFINQFIKKILDTKILYFDYKKLTWYCDIEKIQTISASNNIIELLENRINQLNKDENKLLKIASAIGSKFEETLLKELFNNDEEFYNLIKSLIINEWILKTKDKSNNNCEVYTFAHDRIQQVVYSSIEEKEKQALHKKIAQSIIKFKLHEKNNDFLTFVNHFNKAKNLFKNIDEKNYLAKLNYEASLITRKNGDFSMSKEYMKIAFDFFENIEKETNYCELIKNRAICEHLVLNKEEAFLYYNKAIESTNSDLEKAYIYELIIKFYTELGDFNEAYKTGKEALKLFDLNISEKFNPLIFLKDFLYLKYKLKDIKISEILHLDTAQNESAIIIIKILSAVLKAAYQIDPRLCVLAAMQLIKISLNYGLTKDSVIGFMVYGVIFQGAIKSQHKIGYEYSQLSLKMIEKFNNNELYPEVSFVCGYFGLSWNQPSALTEEIWIDAYSKGLMIGDLFHSGCAAAGIIQSMFLRGITFSEILTQIDIFESELKKIGANEQFGAISSVKQAIRNLQGKTISKISFSDKQFDEKEYLEEVKNYNSLHFAHYYFINKMIVLYFHEEYEEAFKVYVQSKEFLNDSKGTIHGSEHFFYEVLILSKLYEKQNKKVKNKYFKIIKSNLKLFEQYSIESPENFRVRKKIIKSIVEKIENRLFQSIKSLEDAINISEQYSQINLKIIANRLLSNIYSYESKQSKILNYLQEEEYKNLNEWGIDTKVFELKNHNKSFKISTLTKVAEIIVKEQKLPELLKSLLKIVVEKASAQYAVVLLEENNSFYVQASIKNDKSKIMQNIEFSEYNNIIHNVVNFVIRTKKHVIVDDLTKDSIFLKEKEAIKRGVKSILCLPLILQNKIKGIIYLENNALSKIFTKDKIELLKHLSGQIAISIENSLIYKNLEKKVQERTKDLDEKNLELENQNIKLQEQNNKILQLNSNIIKENEKRKKVEEKLQEAINQLDLLATTDALTGLKNRRVFDKRLEVECQKVIRTKETLSLIMCDIDYFKLYNDYYGHLQGDECLKYVAKIMENNLKRPSDLVARYGGEEFAIIMPNTSKESAQKIALQIQAELEKTNIRHEKSQIDNKVTLSMGLTTSDEIAELTIKNLIKEADNRLYKAKGNGRNQIF